MPMLICGSERLPLSPSWAEVLSDKGLIYQNGEGYHCETHGGRSPESAVFASVRCLLAEYSGPYNLGDLRRELRGDDLSGDAWGTVMAWRFAVAGVLYDRGETIPADWEYSPGAGDGRDPDSYADSVCDLASSEDLQAFGAILARYDSALRQAGSDY